VYKYSYLLTYLLTYKSAFTLLYFTCWIFFVRRESVLWCLPMTVVGCANPSLPSNVKVERVPGSTDRLIVKCDIPSSSSSGGETWYLTCHGSRWLGISDLHNCTNVTLSKLNSGLSAVILCDLIHWTRNFYYICCISQVTRRRARLILRWVTIHWYRLTVLICNRPPRSEIGKWVPAKGQWLLSAARKVTVGMVSQCSRITVWYNHVRLIDLSSEGLQGLSYSVPYTVL